MTSPRTFNVNNVITVTATVTPPNGNVVIQVTRFPFPTPDTITITDSPLLVIPNFNQWNPENIIYWRAKRRDQFGNYQIAIVVPPFAASSFAADIFTVSESVTVAVITPLFIDLEGSGFRLIAHTSVRSLNLGDVTTPAINTSGADFIIASIGYLAAAGPPTILDSKSNTWTALTKKEQTFSGNQIIYAKNTIGKVGLNHTFSTSGVGGPAPSLEIAAFAGSDLASPFDAENGTTQAAGPTTVQPGPVTAAQNNELTIASLAFDASMTASIDSGFSISDQENWNSGQDIGSALAWKTKGPTTAENPIWTIAAGAGTAATIAVFKGVNVGPLAPGETVTLLETVIIVIPTFTVNPIETITFTESVTMFRTSNNASVSDSFTITETVTIAVVAANTITIGPSLAFATITVTDTPTLSIANRIPSVNDTATVTDGPPTLALGGLTLGPFASDTVTFSELRTLFIFLANISPSVSDSLQVIETVTMFEPFLAINISEGLIVTDQPFISISTPGTTITIGPPAATQTITISELVTVSVPELKPPTVHDTITLTEEVDIRLSTIGFTVTDSFGVQEDVAINEVPGIETGAGVTVTAGPLTEGELTFLQRLQRRLGEDEIP